MLTKTGEAAGFVWTRARVLTLAVLCLAQVLDGIDVTVVNVALPVIGEDLGFAPADLPWVVNAYMVPFGGFLLLGGRLGDLLGHRRILVAGIGLFTAASVVAGFAPGAGVLVAGRALQGVAAALIAPMTLAMLALSFPEGRPRNRAIAIWGTATGVSSLLGLLVGGVLADGPGWRWIFYVNVPVGLLLLLAAGRYLRADQPVRLRRGFDVVGAITSTAGVGLLAYTVLQTATHGWTSVRTVTSLVGAAVLLGSFVVHEARGAKEPLVPFSLFRNRSVTGANLIQALRGSAMFAVFYFATLYQQEVLGYSALETGLTYLPMTVVLIGAASLGPLLVRRIGVRVVTVIGALVNTGGLLLFARISPSGELVGSVLVPLMVTGLGFAIMIVPLTIAALSGVSAAHSGAASAVLNVSVQLGGAIGLAVLSTAAITMTDSRIQAGAPAATALTEGYGTGFFIAACLMVLVAIIAAVLFRDEGKERKSAS